MIAELFLEGTPLFTFADLLKYRASSILNQDLISKINDSHVTQLIAHMIQLDPNARLEAHEYLDKFKHTIFPGWFWDLHQFMFELLQVRGTLVSNLEDYPRFSDRICSDMDARVDRVADELPSLKQRLGYNANEKHGWSIPFSGSRIFSPTLTCLESATILLSFLLSQLRNCIYPTSKASCLDSILNLAQHVSDEIKLNRVVPYVVSVFPDENAIVRAEAVRGLTKMVP